MLRLQEVTKSYGDRPVLRGLSFAVRAGEVYGLLGPNGAGKTTTINLICHLLDLDGGSVEVGGERVSQKTKSLVGVAPQENLLYRSLTCAENLKFFARIYGLSGGWMRKQVRDCLAAVNLSDRADSVVTTLSGGMQRRLSIAIALVHRPRLVILDEPTTGLDVEARYEIWQLIRELKKQGLAVLLTTHLLDEAERLCDRIGILKQGQIAAEGSLEGLRRKFLRAREILVVDSPEPERAIARARQLGWVQRNYGSDLAFWLPQMMELPEAVQVFDGIPLRAISRQPVRLEHIYLEATQPLEESV